MVREDYSLTYHHDTYNRRIQLGASRRRYEDAEALRNANRWNGAMYLAGYAIECSLKALICYSERTNNFKETKMFKDGTQGAALHHLPGLMEGAGLMSLLQGAGLKRKVALDRTGNLKHAYNTVVQFWQKDELRYGDTVGNKSDCDHFIAAVKELHRFILARQGEAS